MAELDYRRLGSALVKAFIADLITPIIAMIFGELDFGALSFTINGSKFAYGDFINNLITFVVTAAGDARRLNPAGERQIDAASAERPSDTADLFG